MLEPIPTPGRDARERGSEMDSSVVHTPEMCPVRVGEECRLCVPGATGPQDCGLAYLVLTDPSLREELVRRLSATDAGSGDRDESTR